MKKKIYTAPSFRVAIIDSSDIICTSPNGDTQPIGLGDPNDSDVPTPGPDGIIYGDSRSHGVFDDEW